MFVVILRKNNIRDIMSVEFDLRGLRPDLSADRRMDLNQISVSLSAHKLESCVCIGEMYPRIAASPSANAECNTVSPINTIYFIWANMLILTKYPLLTRIKFSHSPSWGW